LRWMAEYCSRWIERVFGDSYRLCLRRFREARGILVEMGAVPGEVDECSHCCAVVRNRSIAQIPNVSRS
jgi:hypothetical protein